MNPSDTSASAQFAQTPTPPIMAAAQGTPDTWPGAFGIFALSRDAIIRNLLNLILLIVFAMASAIILGQVEKHVGIIAAMVISVLSLIPSWILSAAITSLQLYAARGERPGLSKLLIQGVRVFWKLLVIDLILAAMTLVSFLLLVLPFFFVIIYVVPKLSLAHYFVVDEAKNMNPFAALAASWEATDSNFGKVWGIIGVSVLIFLPVLTVIGILVTIPLYFLYSAAFAFLYLYATRAQGQQPVMPTPTPTPVQ